MSAVTTKRIVSEEQYKSVAVGHEQIEGNLRFKIIEMTPATRTLTLQFIEIIEEANNNRDCAAGMRDCRKCNASSCIIM